MPRKKERVQFNCTNCGKNSETTKQQYSRSENHFCCRKCSSTYNNIHRKSKTCKNCENKILKRRTYCSNTCLNEFKTKQMIRLDNFSHRSAKKYLEEIDNKCSICGIEPFWNKKPMNLVLDHIDGNSENGSLKNLRLVCHNCDSQLPTYKGRNIGNGRHIRKERYKSGKSY